MNTELKQTFKIHAALMLSVKERINELEKMINEEKSYLKRHELIDAKAHNEKILINLISSTMTFEPISVSVH